MARARVATSYGCQNWSGGTDFGGGPILSLQATKQPVVINKPFRLITAHNFALAFQWQVSCNFMSELQRKLNDMV